MPEPLAHYGFIPWVRQGIASRIQDKDTLGVGSGTTVERAGIDVEVVLKDREIDTDSSNETTIRKRVQLFGPGDIEGIQARAILRTEPGRNVRNFEPNLLPYIEFYEEDFPWRYTPAMPAASGTAAKRLRPWIVLVVLKKDEFQLNPNTEGLSSFTIKEEAIHTALGNHKDIWAWAHVHLNNPLEATAGTPLADEVNAELADDADSGISRIICPRKLQKSTAYHAFLIPAFETGRLAGLNEKTEGIPAQEPSWRTTGNTNATGDTRKNTFPFYHQWEFATGELGDFETLVSILKPVVTKPESGALPMDIQDPGFALRGVAGTDTLGVEGALKPPGFSPGVFPNGTDDKKFVAALQQILNLSETLADGDTPDALENPFNSAPIVDDPVITPPIYGYYHALVRRLGEPGNPRWVEELNLDPRWRGVAGLGTQIIQKLQEKLMHRAWQQVGDIKEANQQIVANESAKKISAAVFKKHLANAEGSQFTTLSQSMHNRLFSPTFSKTIHAVFSDSQVPLTAKSATLRRILSPATQRNKKINKSALLAGKSPLHKQVVTNFNKETQHLTAAKTKEMPNAAIPFSAINDALVSLETAYAENKFYMAKDILFTVLNAEAPDNINNLAPLLEAVDQHPASADARSLAKEGINGLVKSSYVKDAQDAINVRMADAVYAKIFGSDGEIKLADLPTSKVYANVTISRTAAADGKEWESKSTTFHDIQYFKTAFAELLAKTERPNFLTVDKLAKPRIDGIGNLYDFMKARLQPSLTFDRKLRSRISVYQGNTKKMRPIMAHPKFDEAMYEEVSQISQDYILPNIESLQPDSVTILQTNQKFIESLLTGLNHEMARELLWREFPTDRMGSYFRQFWDVEDNIFEADKESTYDARQLHTWRGALGSHAVSNPSGGYLVLVVRGQLMLKFPNTIVYAQKAMYDPSDATKERMLPSEITEANTKFPTFSAKLEPDVLLFGFALSIDEARGVRATTPSVGAGMNPGWFFVFKERPGEVKFGLDDHVDDMGNREMPTGRPGSWNDLTWEHLVSNPTELETYQISFSKTIEINNPTPQGPAWGTNSADLAHILYQNPVIFARHAQEMLPKD